MALKNHYATLGVARDAEAVVIRAAYKALSQRYHPDKFPPAERAAAHRRMSEINQAFDVLGDPSLRQAYDAQHPHADHQEEPIANTAFRTKAFLVPFAITVGSVVIAMMLAVERKGRWTLAWEFVSGGFQTPSAYSINWLLLIAIVSVGLRVAWIVRRRLTKP